MLLPLVRASLPLLRPRFVVVRQYQVGLQPSLQERVWLLALRQSYLYVAVVVVLLVGVLEHNREYMAPLTWVLGLRVNDLV